MIKEIKQKLNNTYKWIKEKKKQIIAFIFGSMVVLAAPAAVDIIENQLPPTPHVYQVVNWTKPTTDAEWAEDVKKESLNLKFDYQLDEMEISHSSKIPWVQEDLDKFNDCPECIKWELREEYNVLDFDLEGKTLDEFIDDEFNSQFAYYKWKTDKLNQSVERIKKEKDLRKKGFVRIIDTIEAGNPQRLVIDSVGSGVRSPLGTTYYIDSGCGTPGDGTTTTCNGDADDSYDSINDFTEVARSSGDVVIVKRDNTGIDDGGDVAFTSDGSISNPITIESDYANAWSTDVDLSATGTATLTFGSKTVTFSADISGVLAAGDWIYEANDAAKDFAYEVKTVSTVTVTLYLPYKGNNAGSGKTMTNIQAAPVWNTAAGSFQWNFDADNDWKVQGIDMRGTDPNGIVEVDSAIAHHFKDCIFIGNGGSDFGIKNTDDTSLVYVEKCRGSNVNSFALSESFGAGSLVIYIKDSLLSSSASANEAIRFDNWRSFAQLEETEVTVSTNIVNFNTGRNSIVRLRNVLSSNIGDGLDSTNAIRAQALIEDHNGTIGETRFYRQSTSDNTVFYQSETVKVRAGGSNISIKVSPQAEIGGGIAGGGYFWGRLLLFEVPFYATTDSKTYTVYFASDTTTEWTSNPTAAELWCELEAWGHASNNYRKITKSTGTMDFKTDTDFDQSLAVTVAPAQAGVAYLRCYYAKTKEAAKTNIFYVDPIPDVT